MAQGLAGLVTNVREQHMYITSDMHGLVWGEPELAHEYVEQEV